MPKNERLENRSFQLSLPGFESPQDSRAESNQRIKTDLEWPQVFPYQQEIIQLLAGNVFPCTDDHPVFIISQKNNFFVVSPEGLLQEIHEVRINAGSVILIDPLFTQEKKVDDTTRDCRKWKETLATHGVLAIFESVDPKKNYTVTLRKRALQRAGLKNVHIDSHASEGYIFWFGTTSSVRRKTPCRSYMDGKTVYPDWIETGLQELEEYYRNIRLTIIDKSELSRVLNKGSAFQILTYFRNHGGVIVEDQEGKRWTIDKYGEVHDFFQINIDDRHSQQGLSERHASSVQHIPSYLWSIPLHIGFYELPDEIRCPECGDRLNIDVVSVPGTSKTTLSIDISCSGLGDFLDHRDCFAKLDTQNPNMYLITGLAPVKFSPKKRIR